MCLDIVDFDSDNDIPLVEDRVHLVYMTRINEWSENAGLVAFYRTGSF